MGTETDGKSGYGGIARDDIHGESMRYWDERSRGYSLATRMSLNDKDDGIRRLFRANLPDNRRLRVLDVGTGAGYAAIILAQMGHDVVAVDDSEEMLERARSNARRFHVDIVFMKADVQHLDLDEFSFDVIVAKDTVWSLTDPVAAYMDWVHFLRPGGYLLVIDGNYYLDIYDEDYAKRRRYLDMKNGVDNNLHAKTNIDGVDLNRIREIAKMLPLSRERRPSWDVAVMLGMGLVDIRVTSLDLNSYSVLTKDGMMKLPSKFTILARTPYERDKEDSGYVREEMVDRLSQEIISSDVSTVPLFKALADPKRLRMVMALSKGSMSVGQLSRVLEESPSLVSHDLKLLKDGNLVRSSREGKEVHYRLTDRVAIDEIMRICEAMMALRRCPPCSMRHNYYRQSHRPASCRYASRAPRRSTEGRSPTASSRHCWRSRTPGARPPRPGSWASQSRSSTSTSPASRRRREHRFSRRPRPAPS